MPPSLEDEEFIVVSSDHPPDSHNRSNISSSPTNIDSDRPADRDAKRLSAGRRSVRPDPLDKLRAIPEVRPIPWYPGKDLPPEKSTESERVQTRSACLLASRGRVNDPPCSHCATGLGRFSKCISLDEFFLGACSTCHLAARGNSCSIRKRVESTIKPTGEPRQQHAETSQMKPTKPRTSLPATVQQQPKHTSPMARDTQSQTRRTTEQRKSQQESSWTPVQHPNSSLKRKRETLQGTDVWKPYVSPYRPIAPAGHDSPTTSKSPNGLDAATAAHEEPPLLNYIYRKEAPLNGSSRNPRINQLPAILNPAPIEDTTWRPATQNPSRTGISDEPANHSTRREASVSMSPSAQLLQNLTPRETDQSLRIRPSDKSTEPPSFSRDPSLIDSVPRKKKKQIYGILGGLQSGIRSCLRQAESMQKQLDMLQMALGIDAEDDPEASTSL